MNTSAGSAMIAPGLDAQAARRSLIEALGDFARMSHAADALDAKGFTRLQVAILARLARHGSARLTSLAADLAADLSVVSRQAGHLADAGLVDRARDPKDGRAYIVGITDAGREVIADVRRRRDAWLERTLSYWDAEQIAEAATIVRTIVTGVHGERNSRT